jgi:hypothetical protein
MNGAPPRLLFPALWRSGGPYSLDRRIGVEL